MATTDLLVVIRQLHTALMQADATLDLLLDEDMETVALRQEALIAGALALSGDAPVFDDAPILRGIARGLTAMGVRP